MKCLTLDDTVAIIPLTLILSRGGARKRVKGILLFGHWFILKINSIKLVYLDNGYSDTVGVGRVSVGSLNPPYNGMTPILLPVITGSP
jgi:hypothetical protein